MDDEEDIQELLEFNLGREGYNVLCAGTGEEALTIARSNPPALIILDLMLPGMDGLEVCRILKNEAKTEHIPTIMLTAKAEEVDIVTGLELGADDYVTKPFSGKVLVARIRRLLRRKTKQTLDMATVKIRDLTISPARREVLIKGKPVNLTLSEFNLLYTLARRRGLVFTRCQIVDSMHNGDYAISDRAVDVQVACLRKKLCPCRYYIETVRGVGYRFKDI